MSVPVRLRVRSTWSASSSVSAIGFSTSTGLPASSAARIGRRCSPSAVETITAVTSGWEITASLSAEWNCAPTVLASFSAFAGSMSATAMARTAGWPLASRARNVPMRPQPMTPSPISRMRQPSSGERTIMPAMTEKDGTHFVLPMARTAASVLRLSSSHQARNSSAS